MEERLYILEFYTVGTIDLQRAVVKASNISAALRTLEADQKKLGHMRILLNRVYSYNSNGIEKVAYFI